MKICKDCKYFLQDKSGKNHQCIKMQTPLIDLVDGSVSYHPDDKLPFEVKSWMRYHYGNLCSTQRAYFLSEIDKENGLDVCGFDGKFFEERTESIV